MSSNDGGPAFPVLTDRSGGEEFYLGTPGMTLRDWFAGQAIVDAQLGSATYTPETFQGLARNAYRLADAMLAARNSTQPNGEPK